MNQLEIPDRQGNYATLSPKGDQRSLHDIDRELIVSAYKTHGAVLIRGFLYDLELFREFSAQFCTSTVVNNSGGRRTVDLEGNIQTVNLGNDAFPLHPELSRRPWKPDVCWFACVKPPAQGGETTLCDGVLAVQNLRPELFDSLQDRRLKYVEPMTPHDCLTWLNSSSPNDWMLDNPPMPNPYQFFRQSNQVFCEFSRPLFHQPMFCDQLAFGNFLIFSRLYNNVRHFPVFENGDEVPDSLVNELDRTCRASTVAHQWVRNDILMLDNTRFMHGRNEFDNIKDRLIISRFGYLTFAEPDAEEIPNAPWRQQGFWR